MFKRLFVLSLLALATVSVSTPAHAATLAVDWVDCLSYNVYNGMIYACATHASGGTGSYVSYTWAVDSNQGDYTVVTSTDTMETSCYPFAESIRITVTVRDSAGATASGRSAYRHYCGWNP